MSSNALPALVIDGSRIDNFADFVREFSALLEGFEWNGNLDAFNDILRGGCGTPDGGFVLRWTHSARSRAVLGPDATVEWLAEVLERSHPSNHHKLRKQIADARKGKGTMLFDWLVEIIREHGPGGDEAEDNVLLELA